MKISSQVKNFLIGLCILLVTFIAYWQATKCGYIWDDDYYIYNNPTLQDPDGLGKIWLPFDLPRLYPISVQYYPVVYSSFWIESWFWGLNPQGYHAVNILLHALNALLLWRILRLLKIPAATLCAFIFALHPVHVESVAWITERKNVLSGFFYLSSLLVYLQCIFHQQKRLILKYLFSFTLYTLALLSKSVTCSLPAVLVLILWWKRKINKKQIIRLIPFFFIGLLLGLVTIFMEKYEAGAIGHDWNLTFIDRCLIAGRALWFYIGKIIWPHPLIFFYPKWTIDASVWWHYIYPITFLAVVYFLWRFRNIFGRGPLVCLLFFAGTVFPAIGFFNVYPMRFSYVADHFQYLASIGTIIFISSFLLFLADAFLYQLKEIKITLTLAVLMLLGILVNKQISYYKNEEILYRATIKQNPQAYLAHNNLGKILSDQGDQITAINHFRKTIEIYPRHRESYNNLGNAYFYLNDIEKALHYIKTSLTIDPMYADAHYNIANVYKELKQYDKALHHYNKSIEINPLHLKTLNNLGILLRKMNQPQKAINYFKRTLKIKPNSIEALINLGNTYQENGQLDLALTIYFKALNINPNTPIIHFCIANTYKEKKEISSAIKFYENALKLDLKSEFTKKATLEISKLKTNNFEK